MRRPKGSFESTPYGRDPVSGPADGITTSAGYTGSIEKITEHGLYEALITEKQVK
jgi:hypothetical protein